MTNENFIEQLVLNDFKCTDTERKIYKKKKWKVCPSLDGSGQWSIYKGRGKSTFVEIRVGDAQQIYSYLWEIGALLFI